MIDVIALLFILCGLLFFLSGSIGLLRLPDLLCRLHALAKADNIGLAFIMLGTILIDADLVNAIKMVLIWLLVLAASSVSSHLIARRHLQRDNNHE